MHGRRGKFQRVVNFLFSHKDTKARRLSHWVNLFGERGWILLLPDLTNIWLWVRMSSCDCFNRIEACYGGACCLRFAGGGGLCMLI